MTRDPESARPRSALRKFLDSEAAGGIVLMGAAALALLIANSPLAKPYFDTLHAYLGPLSVLHWINDGLMAVFFLFVGLEIKREFLDGQLASWSDRALPGLAAAGGVIVPALIYVGLNLSSPETIKGWAIPAATDIAFALGILSILGSRVPASLKIFLAALAIIDDLVAVGIIAVFYTADINVVALLGAVGATAVLVVMNRMRVLKLAPYLIVGVVLWYLVLRSGVHATVAGVVLAMTIPLNATPGRPEDSHSPLHRLEHGLANWVGFLIVPVFGFANAGVSFAGMSLDILKEPLTLGVAAGLFLGKQLGVFAAAWAAIKFKLATLPAGASWAQLYGVALLCGIGFTMSLFIGLLAFADAPHLQDSTKVGVLVGSALSGLAGWFLLSLSKRRA